MELLVKDFPEEAYALLVEKASREGKTLGEKLAELVNRPEAEENQQRKFPGALERMNRLVSGIQPATATTEMIREDRESR